MENPGRGATDETLGKILVKKGLISSEQLENTLQEARRRKASGSMEPVSLAELLIQKGLVRSNDLLETLSGESDIALFHCPGCGASLTPGEPGGGPAKCVCCGGAPVPLEKTMVLSPGESLPDSPGFQTPPPAEVLAARLDPQRVFGKYVLAKELGRGGTAVVHKAWDTFLRQYVAVKFILTQEPAREGESTSAQQISDFLREARISARLRHPNIVHVYELGCLDHKYYLSMDYIEGPTLYELIHGTRERTGDTYFPTDPEKFLSILRDVALAVDYAHRQNPPLVHRDLKPQNILIDSSQRPYVADFGLAKELSLGHTETLTGVIKGTPWYMAPEQAEGKSKEIDPRTDVYALGVILYEMITGRPPFTGGSAVEILEKIRRQEPERPNALIARVRRENSSLQHPPEPVPKPLETICLKALEKKKYHRYLRAKDFADDLDRYLHSRAILAQEPGLRRRVTRWVRSHPLVTGGATALVLSMLLVYSLLRGPAAADPAGVTATRARRLLSAGEWGAFRAAVSDLQSQSPDHPDLGGFLRHMDEHDRRHEEARRRWESALERLRTDPEALKEAEEAFHVCRELQDRMRLELQGVLMESQEMWLRRASELAGDGNPRDSWLNEPVKEEARRLMRCLAGLRSLRSHRLFTFAPRPAVSEIIEALQRLLHYQGTWELQANVVPFAEVVLLRESEEVARDFTPLSFRNLGVSSSSYRAELYWPSRGDFKVRVNVNLENPRHKEKILLVGNMEAREVRVRR